MDFSVHPSGHRSRATHLPSGFACTSCSTQILEVSIVPAGSFVSHLSGKQPPFLPWKDCHEPHNQPRCYAFSCGLSLASQVNPSSSSFSGDHQNPDMPPPGVKFQSKSWFTKPPLMTGLIGFIQRNLMSSLTASECQIMEESGREKNTNCEGKSFSF